MKIVHLADYFQPALGYQEAALARQQLRLGHEVTVVTSDRYAPFADYERTLRPVLGERIRGVGRGTEEGIPVVRLPIRVERSFRCWLRGLGPVLAELGPDVVHAHCVVKFTTLQAACLKAKLGYRLLVDDHMHQVNLNNKGFKGATFYRMFRSAVAPWLRQQIDSLAAITEETAAIVREVYGLTRPAVQVIELGVDTDLFKRQEDAGKQLRGELGFAPEDFVVIYTGKLIFNKAPHWLLEALPRCPPQVKVLLVGNASEDYLRTIDKIISDCHMEKRVVLRAAVKQVDLPLYYSAADAGCWPREASLAMLEAAACELPIVITAGGLSARVRWGNGLEYQQGDLSDLARCLSALASQPEKSRWMGQQGRRLVEEHYSWVKINEQFLAAYRGGQN